MIGCLRTHVPKQPSIALYFEFENELKLYNLEAKLSTKKPLSTIRYKQQIFKSVGASALSDQCLSFTPEETLDTWLSIEHPSKTDQTAQIRRVI